MEKTVIFKDMQYFRKSYCSFLMALFLTALQTVTPLVHAHTVDSGSSMHAAGIHFHADDDLVSYSVDKTPTLKNPTINMHTFVVGSGRVAEQTLNLEQQVLFVFFIWIALLLITTAIFFPAFSAVIRPPPLRYHLAARAPPLR